MTLLQRFVWFLIPVACPVLALAAEVVNPDAWVSVSPGASPTFDNLQIPADAASRGLWSPVADWPMNGLHAVLLPDGKVLSFGTTPDGNSQNGRWYDVWDPALGLGDQAHNTVYDPTRQDSFCAAAAYRSDGRLLISGGNGETTSTLYETASHSSYTDPSSLAEARWYPTMINLPDGRPLMLGGMVPYTETMVNNPDQAIASGWPSMTPEVYENGAWRSLFGAYSREAFGPDYLRASFPHAWVAPNGLVFGISADKMWYLDVDANGGNGAITWVADFKQPYNRTSPVNVGSVSAAAMFAPGKILQVGGNGGYNADGYPASDMATVIDINGAEPDLIEQPRMTHPRRYPNAIVLASGQVVVTGGTTYGNHYADEPGRAVYAAEIWDPRTGTWTESASARVIRVYHSVTTLLADGTILSTGGGTPGPVTNLNAEIYYPPYLFEAHPGGSRLAPRPLISAISGLSYDHNASLQLDLAEETPISQLVLIGVSSTTHSFNTGQRRIPLDFSQDRFRLTITLPRPSLAPPGYYQLVAVDENGTPSKAVIIALGQGQAPPPVVVTPYEPPVVTEPISTPTARPGEPVSYEVTATPGTEYSWSFSDNGETTAYSPDPRITHTYSQPGLYVVTLTTRDSSDATSTKTVVQAVSTPSLPGAARRSSQLLVEPRADGGEWIWTVNPDNNTVAVVDSANHQLLAEVAVGESPRALARADNGEIWVSNKHSASLSVIDPDQLQVVREVMLPRASQPHGLVIDAQAGEAYVVLEALGQLRQLDLPSGDTLATLALGPNPRHLSLTKGGSAAGGRLLVSRFVTPPLPGEAGTNVDTGTGGGEVIIVDPQSMTRMDTVRLRYSDLPDTPVQGSGVPNYLAAPALAPDGSHAWVPGKQDNIGRGALRNGSPLTFENTVRAVSSRIDLSSLTEDYPRRLDHDNASLASAALYHPNGVYLFVALETSREVAVIDALGGTELFRIDTGIAPQDLALAGDGLTLYVKELLSRRIRVVSLRNLLTRGELEAATVAEVATVQNEILAPEVLAGKRLFYDARDPRLARDSYLSCASCHNDGNQDGRVWDFAGMGEGLRNTIALNGRAGQGQGFLHWSANFDEVQDFEGQIRNLAGGTGLMADSDYFSGTRHQPLGDKKAGLSPELDQLAAYVGSLKRVEPSPYRNEDGSMTAAATAGRGLFLEHCSACHNGAGFSISGNTSAMRDVGTLTSASGQRLGSALTGLDVPGLRDAWATAPYLHDGSAPDLAAAIGAHQGLQLSLQQMNDLVAYVRQIGTQEPGQGLSPLAQWSFAEGSGSRATDRSAFARVLSLSNSQWVASPLGVGEEKGALQYNGVNAVASSDGPMLDTSASYSVAAWVQLADVNGWQTFVNQDGQRVSGFWLQFSEYQGSKFLFTTARWDSTMSPVIRALSNTVPVPGEWYHLVGVRDAEAGKLRLYVNGQLEGQADYSARWTANGNLNLGRGKYGSPNAWAAAIIDEVGLYQYALSSADVARLFEQEKPQQQPAVNLANSADLDTSYLAWGADLDAVNDGYEPENSRDSSHGVYSNARWWGGTGRTNWVSFQWDQPQTLSAMEVYWYEDGWRTRLPDAASAEFWDGGNWVRLGDIGGAGNRFNRLEFAVSTRRIRVLMRSSGYTGIIEARVLGQP